MAGPPKTLRGAKCQSYFLKRAVCRKMGRAAPYTLKNMQGLRRRIMTAFLHTIAEQFQGNLGHLYQ